VDRAGTVSLGEALTFGSDITFLVDLKIPATLTGDSGSELSIEVTGPDLLTPLLTADSSGNLVTMSYDTTGALTVLSTNPNTAGVPAVSAVPEPGGWMRFGTLLVPLFLVRRKRITTVG
jgi:hypothetical protein